jgi:hypothetical protein
MFNRLPLRATNVIREYSFPITRSNWINLNSKLDVNYDSDDEIEIHSFPITITILIIVFNTIICLSTLYLLCVVIGSIVCMYNSCI